MSRQNLIREAKQLLRDQGFSEDQIYEDFVLKNCRIDVVGWSKEAKTAIECGDCDEEKLEELRKFFDEVLCLTAGTSRYRVTRQKVAPRQPRKPYGRLAGLKLLLTRGDDVLFEAPLSLKDWSRDQFEDELASLEEEFRQYSKLFDALSHETRLRMMKHLLEDEDQTVSFVEFVRDLDLNPKIVWENARKLSEGGLLEKVEKGRYRCSEFGRMELMLSLALRRLMETLEEF